MKRIISLLLAIGTLVAVHAQSSKDEARRVVLGPSKTTRQERNIVLGRNSQREQHARWYKEKRTIYYGKKTNPGKHLGWYKGKGNPHKYGTAGKNKGKWKGKKIDD